MNLSAISPDSISFTDLLSGYLPAIDLDQNLSDRIKECQSAQRIIDAVIPKLEAKMKLFDENYFDLAERRDKILEEKGLLSLKLFRLKELQKF